MFGNPFQGGLGAQARMQAAAFDAARRAQAGAAFGGFGALSVDHQIRAFATATDQSGALKHPHFEAVREAMAELMVVSLNLDLETAYRIAVDRAGLGAQQAAEPAAEPDADVIDLVRQADGSFAMQRGIA